MRRRLLALLPVGVVACSFTTEDYRDRTQDFLNDDERVEAEVGADVTDAVCEEPSATEVGTAYTCRAQVEGQGEFVFDVVIDAEDSFLVTGFEPA